MPTVPVYNVKGEKVGEQTLSDGVFGVRAKPHVVATVVEALRANLRRATAHTKKRGEVRGGGKKPWKQKGTGRARAGSIRSPLWRGGGIIFGPRSDRNYTKKVNARLRSDAIRMVFSDKVAAGQFVVVDMLTFPEGKTKTAAIFFKHLAKATGCAFTEKPTTLLLDEAVATVVRSTRNLRTVQPCVLDAVNVLTLLQHPYVVTTAQGVKKIEERFGKTRKAQG